MAPSRCQGWGLLSQFSLFSYFSHFPLLSKQMLGIEYHVYIWQVLPQLSCGDTCQIWMWFRESNRYICKIENFAYGEISERSFSNPHPRSSTILPTPVDFFVIGSHLLIIIWDAVPFRNLDKTCGHLSLNFMLKEKQHTTPDLPNRELTLAIMFSMLYESTVYAIS